MADSAFQTRYRDEYVAAFERRASLLRGMVTTESEVKAGTAVFLVAGSGGATAVTRGLNGLIPARADDLNQFSCVLAEWHDLVRKTGFNIFASQGDQTRIMQESTMAVLNRKTDALIIAQLELGTQDSGAAATMSLNLVTLGIAILGNADAGGSNVHCAITPAAFAYLLRATAFTSADFVNIKPLAATNEMIQARFSWAGVEFVVHTGLTGRTTNAEKCLMWNKAAIGHGVDKNTLQTPVGRDEEQDYSWARATAYMGSKLLQNGGVVTLLHDGSALVAV